MPVASSEQQSVLRYSNMKLFLLLALAVAALAHAEEASIDDVEHEYMYFPDGEGEMQLIDLAAKADLNEEALQRNVNTVTFQLYTRQNPWNPQFLVLNNVASLTNSNWSHLRQTRFITHGWRSSRDSEACTAPRDSYLAVGDYNVIVVDWSQIASQVYVTAAGSVRSVAARVGEMITFLNRAGGLNYATTKFVGHSLGGHVAGLGARAAAGTLQAVIALDPALPTFNNAGAGSRVDRTDATHVQVIHTNGGLLGIMNPIGDSDFYPNGGQSQPGCGVDVAGACAHSRAYLFFAESIRNPHGFRANGHSNIFMGGRWLVMNARGSYHLTTRDRAPFAMG